MTRETRLIVNADGFGFGPGATRGVIDAVREGRFITSVTVNANFAAAEQIADFAREFPGVSIGVHLNALAGRPCLPPGSVPSLVGPDGEFHGSGFSSRLRAGSISHAELEAEFDAQIAKVKDLVGDNLTHLDSQANSHLHYFDLFLSLAEKWKIERIRTNASLICLEAPHPRAARLRTYLPRPHVWLGHRYRAWQMRAARRRGLRLADRLVTIGYGLTGNKTSLENWLRVLGHLGPGTYEIYCHPGYPDATLRRWASYVDERSRELEVLRRPELARAAEKAGVRLISFFDI